MRPRRIDLKKLACSVAGVVLVLASGCARATQGEAGPGAASPFTPLPADETVVSVDLFEDAIRASSGTVQQGSIRFVAYNRGSQDHELVIARTDLPFDQLPVNPENDSVEEGDDVRVVAEIEPDELPPGKSASTTVELQEGKYVLLCNISGHYRQGMRQAFTVTG